MLVLALLAYSIDRQPILFQASSESTLVLSVDTQQTRISVLILPTSGMSFYWRLHLTLRQPVFRLRLETFYLFVYILFRHFTDMVFRMMFVINATLNLSVMMMMMMMMNGRAAAAAAERVILQYKAVTRVYAAWSVSGRLSVAAITASFWPRLRRRDDLASRDACQNNMTY